MIKSRDSKLEILKLNDKITKQVIQLFICYLIKSLSFIEILRNFSDVILFDQSTNINMLNV